MTTTTNWTVTGMTCGHCANAITSEVSDVVGVSAVTVDRDQQRMTVTATAEVTPEAIVAAVAEAGNYTATPEQP